jgi:putative transposase
MEPGKKYHIYTHANGFENLFRSQENYRYFLSRYEHFIDPIANTLAYCLMPNHVHFLVEMKNPPELDTAFGPFETEEDRTWRISRQFASLFSSYTQAFNKMYKRRGSLFIPNFKRKEVNNDNYLIAAIRYIHRNPVTHGFADTMDGWRWSSYPIFTNNIDSFLKRQTVLEFFGNQEHFERMHGMDVETIESAEDWFL